MEVEIVDLEPSLMFMTRAMIEPVNDPSREMAQKMLNALPLSFSRGYDITMHPCADRKSAAEMPRMAPAKTTNQRVP